MDSDAGAWWTVRYPQVSIKELERIPLYEELKGREESWEANAEECTTKGVVRTDEITITKNYKNKSETLTHAKETWTLTISETKSSYELTTISNLKGEEEWGSISKKFASHTIEETWKVLNSEKVFARTCLESGIRKGLRAGITLVKGHPCRWVEEVWEEAGEQVFKKSWDRPGESGGETRMDKDDYSWGSHWFSSGIRAESKLWHRQRTHQWGHEHGHELDISWKHEWDLDVNLKKEDKTTLKKGRVTGYRYRQDGADWHKEEWEGRKLLSEQPQTDDAAMQSLYQREYEGTLKSQAVLDSLVAFRPEFEDQSLPLKAKIANIHAQPRVTGDEAQQRALQLRDVQDFQEALKAQVIKNLEVKPALNDGKLFEIVKAHKMLDAAPTPSSQLFKFFEDFLDAKYVDDTEHFEKGISPSTTANFLPPYVQQTASKSEAFLKLAQLLNGLKQLKLEQHPYAALLCKLLGICGTEAAPYQLSLFLIRVRKEFQRMANNYKVVATGPERKAALSDVIHFVYDLFKNDPERGQELLQGLKPESLECDDYSSFLICARLHRLGFTPASVFHDFGSAKVKEPVLVGSLKLKLDLWLNEEEISQVFSPVEEEKGFISQTGFEERLAFNNLDGVAKSHPVTEGDFLLALIHVYSTKTSKDSQHLSRAFDSLRGRDMSQTRFTEVLKSIDSVLTDQQVQVIVESALKHAGPAHIVSKEAFVEALLDYPIGEYRKSVFGKRYCSPAGNEDERMAFRYSLVYLRIRISFERRSAVVENCGVIPAALRLIPISAILQSFSNPMLSASTYFSPSVISVSPAWRSLGCSPVIAPPIPALYTSPQQERSTGAASHPSV